MSTPSAGSPSAGPPDPTPAPLATTAKVTMPTLGSMVGSIGGTVIASKFGITDPVTLGTVITIVTMIATGLFHFVGEKLGVKLS